MWIMEDEDSSLDGPLDTEDAFNEAFMHKFLPKNTKPGWMEFDRQAISLILRDHPPLFAHGDMQRCNIMIRRIPSAASINASIEAQHSNIKYGTFILTIINWECAGRYPSYWEYISVIFACLHKDDDWYAWVRKAVDPFFSRDIMDEVPSH